MQFIGFLWQLLCSAVCIALMTVALLYLMAVRRRPPPGAEAASRLVGWADRLDERTTLLSGRRNFSGDTTDRRFRAVSALCAAALAALVCAADGLGTGARLRAAGLVQRGPRARRAEESGRELRARIHRRIVVHRLHDLPLRGATCQRSGRQRALQRIRHARAARGRVQLRDLVRRARPALVFAVLHCRPGRLASWQVRRERALHLTRRARGLPGLGESRPPGRREAVRQAGPAIRLERLRGCHVYRALQGRCDRQADHRGRQELQAEGREDDDRRPLAGDPELAISKQARKAARRALGASKQVRAKLAIAVVDAAGTRRIKYRTVRLRL